MTAVSKSNSQQLNYGDAVPQQTQSEETSLKAEFDQIVPQMKSHTASKAVVGIFGGLGIAGGFTGSILVGIIATSYVAIPILLCLVGVISACGSANTIAYDNFVVWKQLKAEAKQMTLGELVEKHGVKYLRLYNILTKEERLQKWEQWKQNPQTRNKALDGLFYGNTALVSELLENGFVPENDILAWMNYEKIYIQYNNNYAVNLTEAWEFFCQTVNYKLDNQPREKLRQAIQHKLLEEIPDLTTLINNPTPSIINAEYRILVRLKQQINANSCEDQRTPCQRALLRYQANQVFESFKPRLTNDVNQVLDITKPTAVSPNGPAPTPSAPPLEKR